MAHLEVKRKSRAAWVLWVLLVIVLLIVVLMWLQGRQPKVTENETTTSRQQSRNVQVVVYRFSQ